MSKAEAFEVNFADNKSIGVNVNFSKGDAIQVPVSINSLDAEKVGKEVGDRIAEKLDETALASVAKESTLLVESQTIQDAVRNIDLSSIEKKIDNIKLPEIDTSAIAKQGENQDATNTAIYALLSQFGESVLQEKVTVILNCQESIVWQDYTVNVTFEDGRVQAVPLSENGTCSFSIKIGQTYSVQLPVIGTFIAPELKTYTAISSAREIYWSYVPTGIFGMDELGRRYSIAQIEALADKSIIKYGGIATTTLENSLKADGSSGNSFMWKIGEEFTPTKMQNLTAIVEEELQMIPIIRENDYSDANLYYDGESYTNYLISEANRLSVDTPMSKYSREQIITIDNNEFRGFVPSAAQMTELFKQNKVYMDELYLALERNPIVVDTQPYSILMTSCLFYHASTSSVLFARLSSGYLANPYYGNEYVYGFIVYPLYK